MIRDEQGRFRTARLYQSSRYGLSVSRPKPGRSDRQTTSTVMVTLRRGMKKQQVAQQPQQAAEARPYHVGAACPWGPR